MINKHGFITLTDFTCHNPASPPSLARFCAGCCAGCGAARCCPQTFCAPHGVPLLRARGGLPRRHPPRWYYFGLKFLNPWCARALRSTSASSIAHVPGHHPPARIRAAPAATRAIIAQQSEILHDQPGDEEVPALFLHAPCHTRPFRARDLTSIRSRVCMVATPEKGTKGMSARATRAAALVVHTRSGRRTGLAEYELEDGGSAII